MIKSFLGAVAGLVAGLTAIGAAQAATLCTVLADAQTRSVLLAEGDCETRVTPASTFKIPLAVMAFDAGLITSTTEPTYPFREGYPDWVASWRQDTNPAMWIHNSNVWYSQRLTEQLGADRLSDYAARFGFGNADFSGDPGRDNGLERAWISSSLKVSPLEQAGFVAAMIEGHLPVPRSAVDGAISLMEAPRDARGWQIWGKTGSAYPRRADQSFDYTRGWGWYVGWAEMDGRRVVFARLNQDDRRHEASGGLRARDELVEQWPALTARAGL